MHSPIVDFMLAVMSFTVAFQSEGLFGLSLTGRLVPTIFLYGIMSKTLDTKGNYFCDTVEPMPFNLDFKRVFPFAKVVNVCLPVHPV